MPAQLVTLTNFSKSGALAISRSTNANLFTDISAISTLNNVQKKALMVYFAMNQVYSARGSSVDYRSDLSALRTATALLFGSSRPIGIPGDQFKAAQTAIAYNDAIAASNAGNSTTISTDIPTLLATDPILQLTRYSEDELDRFWLTLRYLLGF